MPATIGILWCGRFERDFLDKILTPDLQYAYRAPSLFHSVLIQTGAVRSGAVKIEHFCFDEALQLRKLSGPSAQLLDVDILYVTTHGIFRRNGYEAMLTSSLPTSRSWAPNVTGIGYSGPKVAIFDTCWLIDPSQPWRLLWQNNLGPKLRIMLGFTGPAAIDRGSATRGGAFALNLANGRTFADAWLDSVTHTTTSQYKKAIAIGIGDAKEDARSTLEKASLTNLPDPRTGSPAQFAIRQ